MGGGNLLRRDATFLEKNWDQTIYQQNQTKLPTFAARRRHARIISPAVRPAQKPHTHIHRPWTQLMISLPRRRARRAVFSYRAGAANGAAAHDLDQCPQGVDSPPRAGSSSCGREAPAHWRVAHSPVAGVERVSSAKLVAFSFMSEASVLLTNFWCFIMS